MNRNHFFSLFFGAFLLANTEKAFSQNEDMTWLLGGGISDQETIYKSVKLTFTSDSILSEVLPVNFSFIYSNSSICDSSGNLLFYTNGDNLYHGNVVNVPNGNNLCETLDIPYGVPYIQGYILLPTVANTTVMIYGNPMTFDGIYGPIFGYTDLRYAIIDNETKTVVERDQVISTDTLHPFNYTAVRHGNGRDWWLIALHYTGDGYRRFLVTQEGVEDYGVGESKFSYSGFGQSCFSPDGKYYANFSWHGYVPDSSFATVTLNNFDRCSGVLSDGKSFTYDSSGINGKPGGVAFSPSSRYLYVSCWDTLFQYDLHAMDVWGSREIVGIYDGFLGDFDLPTRFFTMLLAPNNKIYCSVSNFNSRYLHVINAPDSSGTACDFQQHGFELPVLNNYAMPNIPYYRLWEWEDSPCDTIQTVSAHQASFQENRAVRLYPNPTNTGAFNITGLPVQQEGYHVRINDVSGRLVYEVWGVVATNGDLQVAWQSATPGMYVVDVFSENFYRQLKLVVQH